MKKIFILGVCIGAGFILFPHPGVWDALMNLTGAGMWAGEDPHGYIRSAEPYVLLCAALAVWGFLVAAIGVVIAAIKSRHGDS